ncbi:Ribose import ATP-binding protein RbsA [bioreactor metagenome]|uniref:Ribose import ATP-binding protein RbsA n=1 Tax=bioreactor metagenome TaxID=1076179 RepID=A0A644VPE8_9ZZZZ
MKVLEANNITKTFPGVVALDCVDITFNAGEIHCIIGENGAGKSTLIRCLTGVYAPEEGSITINGGDALKDRKLFNKVAYVPQEIDLFGYMTVAENLLLPYERSGIKGRISQKVLEEKARPLLERFQINVDPGVLVKDIPVSAQQLIQIVRAIAHTDYDILMLDEPTTSLTTEDTTVLFKVIRELKNENKAVVFISHKLEEIFEVGDVLTVFRNGKKIAYSDIKSVDIPWVILQMTGHSLDRNQVFHSGKVLDDIILEVKNLSGGMFTDVSFNLKRGEILGFTGLVGAGRSEIMQAILGYVPAYSGQVFIDGKELKLGNSSRATKAGYVYLPEERKRQGILPVLSIRENISISVLDSLLSGIGISKKKECELTQDVINTYGIKTTDMEKEIRYLSGGNQQKVIIGRAMVSTPKVMVFDEPTKGIDVGTKPEIYRMMKKLAEEQSMGIILISSEMEEIIKCSNRIIAMYQGSKIAEFPNGTPKEELMSAIIGVS